MNRGGAFYILISDKALEDKEYNDLLTSNYLNVDDYEYDDIICQENDCEWHIRVYVVTDAYWTFVYYVRDSENY